MPSSVPANANATLRKSRGDALGGGCVGLPKGTQLPLTTREKLTSAFEHEWLTRLLPAARKDLAEYGDEVQIARHFEYEETQLSRVLNGKANPPGWLIAFVLWRCQGRNLIRAGCGLANGLYEPLPEPTEAEDALAIVAALRAKGMELVAREWANLPPRGDAP